jgi:hypothetical protein
MVKRAREARDKSFWRYMVDGDTEVICCGCSKIDWQGTAIG